MHIATSKQRTRSMRRYCSFLRFSPRCAAISVRCKFFNESQRMLVYGTRRPKDERRVDVSQNCCPFTQNVLRLVSTELRAELNLHCGPAVGLGGSARAVRDLSVVTYERL
jgi:hypothetical protein